MKTAYFPLDLLNESEIADLSADHKLLLAGSSIHPVKTACGVIRLTDYVLTTLSFLPGVGQAVAADLARRDIAVYNPLTREFFIKKNFEWNKTPTEAGENSPWAAQVHFSLGKVSCPLVKAAVVESISDADREKAPASPEDGDTAKAAAGQKKLPTVGVPTNLLTALPRTATGKRWTTSELLLLLAMYVDQGGAAPGLLVADPDALGSLCSLPPKTVLECVDTLAAGAAIGFDSLTHETCVFARVKHATTKELPSIAEAVDNLHSRAVKHTAKRHFSRSFPTFSNKSTTSASKEKKGKIKEKERENKGTTADAAGLAASPPAATAFLTKIEELRKNGARTKDADFDVDKRRLERIVDFAAAVGDSRILEVIQDCTYPLEALKACEAVPSLLEAVRNYKNPVLAAVSQSLKAAQAEELARLQAEADAAPQLQRSGGFKHVGELLEGSPA